MSEDTTKNASDAVVWAAFCGCTFEEGPAFAGGALEVQQIPKLAYVPHRANVATGELALPKADVRR